MKVSGTKTKNMVKDRSTSAMVVSTKDSSIPMKYMVRDTTIGKMRKNIKAIGNTTRCQAKEK